jgi:hypothetical protein
MEVRLPIFSLLVELAVYCAEYHDARETRTEKLVSNTVDKYLRVEILECRFGSYPIFVHKRD